MPRRAYALLWPLALAAPGALPSDLPPIVITPLRTESPPLPAPAPLVVVPQADVESAAAPDLADLLRSRAGVQARDLFGDGRSAVLDLRGFGAAAGSNTLVLVDGRPINNSSDQADPDLSALSLFDLERVEILPGSAGALYGNQAVGGLVNLVSRRPEGREARVSATLGTYGSIAAGIALADRLAAPLTARFSATHNSTDGYRDHNATRTDGGRLRADLDVGAGSVFVELQALRQRQQTPGALFADEVAQNRRQSAAVYRNDYSDTDTSVGRVGLAQPVVDGWRVEGELGYRESDRRFRQSFRFFPGTTATQDRTVWTLSPRLLGRLTLGEQTAEVTLGVDVEQTDYDLVTGFGPQRVDQTVWGVYGQLVVPLGREWSTTLGLRHAGVDNAIDDGISDYDLDDTVTVGSAGLSWQLSDTWRLYARADQNFRFAKVDEHTNVVFGTPVGLDTQTGISYEAGAEYSAPGLWLRALAYQLDLDDEISFDSSGYANINLDETRRRGLGASGEWRAAGGLKVGADYSYTGNRVTSGPFEDSRIPLVAEHSGRVYADWAPTYQTGLHAEAVFVGPRVLGGDFANAFPDLDGYGVVNLAGRVAEGRWRVDLRINNLLDHRYSDVGAVGFDETFVLRDAYFPSPERTVWLSASYQLDAR
jgi:iron complex outermembrane receptor protein